MWERLIASPGHVVAVAGLVLQWVSLPRGRVVGVALLVCWFSGLSLVVFLALLGCSWGCVSCSSGHVLWVCFVSWVRMQYSVGFPGVLSPLLCYVMLGNQKDSDFDAVHERELDY